MGLRAAFMVDTILGLVFGVGFVVAPGVLLSIFGVEYDVGTLYVGQLLGAAFIALTVIVWFARESSDWRLVRAILMGLLIFDVIGVVVSVVAVLGGVMNELGWLVVAVLLLPGLGKIYFLFVKRVSPGEISPGEISPGEISPSE